jgi:catechol 2,3-dioxygenase-like lactoylglutathione lyase family enzyme
MGGAPIFTIQLTVADLGTTEAFYVGILQLPVQRGFTMHGSPEHLVLKQEGWELIFVEENAVIRLQPLLEERLTEYPKGVGMSLHFRVEEIEDIADALDNEGLEILFPLEEKPFGMKELWCFDPDGYLVALEEPSR